MLVRYELGQVAELPVQYTVESQTPCELWQSVVLGEFTQTAPQVSVVWQLPHATATQPEPRQHVPPQPSAFGPHVLPAHDGLQPAAPLPLPPGTVSLPPSPAIPVQVSVVVLQTPVVPETGSKQL